MTKAVFLDFATLSPRDLNLEALKSCVDEWVFYDSTSLAEVESRIADANIIVTNKVEIDRYSLQAAKHLQLICVTATGVNNIDLEAAHRQGIPVCNCRNYSTPAVVQHTFGLMFSLNMALTKYHSRVTRGAWVNSLNFCMLDFPTTEVAGKTLGIIGLGDIGRAVARVADALSMTVLSAQLPGRAPSPDKVPFDAFLSRCDIVSIHCPLSETTLGLIGEKELSTMKPSALLINTARGGIVDEQALADALKNKVIAGAGFDVLSKEPPPPEHPLMDPSIPNFILTPHTAWTTRESRQRLVNQLHEIIEKFSGGQIINRVEHDPVGDPARGTG